MKFPVGPKTMEKAAKTEAGKLAAALNRVMYSADYADIALRSSYDANGLPQYNIHARRYVCADKTFYGSDALPLGVSSVGHGGSYFEPEQLLFVIRDYLEAAAIREVCE